jgi:hypothetical protein
MIQTEKTHAIRALERHLTLRHAAPNTVATYVGAARRFIDHVD